MSTALAPFASATLLFQVPVGSLSDPLGNPATDTEPLIMVAYLKTDRGSSGYRQQPLPDGQEAGQAVKGYLIAPTLMPAAIQAEQVAACTFWRVGMGDGFVLPASGFEELSDYEDFVEENGDRIAGVGDFFWEFNLPGGFGVEAVIGDKIRGRFVARSSWADSL